MPGGVLGTVSAQVRVDIRQAVAAYASLRAQNQRFVYALRGTGDSFVQSGKVMGTAGLGLVAVFGKMVLAAGEFERKMDFAAAVSNTTGKEMQKLSNYALQLGQDTIYSAGEIADGFIELAKAGVSAEQIIGGIGKAMANLGAAGDIPLAKSGQIITSTIQQFDLAARDAVKVTDLLAGAANASIADIDDIGVSLKYVGGVANAAGLTFEDTATAISLLAKAGIRGSTAGTSLRQMIVSLGGATKPAREALKDIGIITEDGANAFYTATGRLKPLSQVYQILNDHLDGYNQKEKLAYLRTIFNNRALSAAAILTRDGAKGFREMNAEMLKTTAADVARQRLDNLSGDIEILKGNIETLVIQQGGPLQKTARQWVQALTKLIQAYSELDPKMQEAIVKTIGYTGAALVAMGAINILVGTVFKFVAGMLKMGAGIKFAFKMMKILIFNARLAAALFAGPLVAAISALSLPVLLIIAAIAALVVGLVIAYKKSDAFRKVVDSVASAVWDAVKAVGDFFKLLATDPGAAWDKIKKGAEIAAQAIVGWFSGLGGKIKGWLSAGVKAVQDFVTDVGEWFAQLPGKVLGLILTFVNQVVQLFTFKNIGYAIGFMIGTVIKLWLTFQVTLWSLAGKLVNGIIGFFLSLPAKIGYLIGFLIGTAIRLWLSFTTTMLSLAARLIIGLVMFFVQLPGRISSFIQMMVSRGISLFMTLARALPGLAAAVVSGVVRFFATLPGRVASFVQAMVSRAKQLMQKLPGMAADIGKGIYDGLSNAISGLPGLVAGVLGNVISAFKGVVSQGFNAAKDFAGGLWDGFKDGLGINSPSFIEKHMFQMNDTVNKETRKLAKQTMHVQKIGKKWVDNSPLTRADSSAPSIKSIASLQSTTNKRAETLATSLGSVGKTPPSSTTDSSSSKQLALVSGTLSIDENGTAFITGLAEDAADRFNDDQGRRSRMYYDGE